MIRFIARRLSYSLLVLWGVVTLVFFLFNVLPGDPARLTMGQRTDVASIENARKAMNLDKPLVTRYLLYLNNLSPISVNEKVMQERYHFFSIVDLPGDNVLVAKWPYLGRSYRTQKEVNTILWEALPGTLILALTAMLFATFFGILLGVLAALKKNTWVDSASVAAIVAGISMPSFFAGLIIAFVFGYLLHAVTGLNMTGSLWQYDPFSGRHLALQNLILPALALGIRPLAIITQLTRSALLDALSQDYIRTAYAKGLSTRRVVFRHALPNALNPVITAISGWLAELLAGSFFVEYIFGWKGVGKITVDALDKFDFPLVMGSVLLTALIFIVVNLFTDLLYAKIDPRVKLQ
ncbi:ABC transporter permease [Flavipsychrobacter stenotrophus]|uniref:ABC transporter permease n=1 Tax=Flavipsychrobacter stenotrophus TaxID=2077091 RepID=A0A2S7SXD6_9BACT|nr:ABC transporter permease [Flavipsychrobacter stenotrophus]PQJ11281.1 ABC transporter permease [Flavipsychrobacter stenotrophus]